MNIINVWAVLQDEGVPPSALPPRKSTAYPLVACTSVSFDGTCNREDTLSLFETDDVRQQ